MVVLATVSAPPMFAADAGNLSQILSDTAEHRHVLDVAKHSTAVLKAPCSSASFNLLNTVVIYKAVQTDGAGGISAGAWKQTVSEEGCGKRKLLNVFVSADPDTSTLKAFPLLPGTTHADVILQRDAIKYAVTAAGGPEKSCDIGYVSDTKFLRTTGTATVGAHNPPWDELWTLVTCTKQAQVIMHFIPDKTGTTIATDQSETTLVPNQIRDEQ